MISISRTKKKMKEKIDYEEKENESYRNKHIKLSICFIFYVVLDGTKIKLQKVKP